jgi:hypothetical protein
MISVVYVSPIVNKCLANQILNKYSEEEGAGGLLKLLQQFALNSKARQAVRFDLLIAVTMAPTCTMGEE